MNLFRMTRINDEELAIEFAFVATPDTTTEDRDAFLSAIAKLRLQLAAAGVLGAEVEEVEPPASKEDDHEPT